MTDPRAVVSVRYMVDDVDEAVVFYTKTLGFSVLNNFAPRSRMSRATTFGCCSADRRARPADRCPMAPSPDPVVGTAFT